MFLKKSQILLFGSFTKGTQFNDIDALIIVDDICNIEKVKEELNLLNKIYPNNIIHIHIYTRMEYNNPKNKFSYINVNKRISYTDLLLLYESSKIL